MKDDSSTTVFILGLANNFRGIELYKFLTENDMKVILHFGYDGNAREIPQDWRDDKRSRRLYRKILSNQEIACSLGHKQMIDLAVNENSGFTLFLEDDVSCVSGRKLKEFISTATTDTPMIWTFPIFDDKSYSTIAVNSWLRTFVENQSTPSGAFAYLMNNQALHSIDRGFRKYGFQGYVADFPAFFPDFITFGRGPTGIFVLNEVDSVLGELRSRARLTSNAFDYVKSLGDLLFINWFISSYRDSGAIGFFKIRHMNFLRKILNLFSRIER
jgi:hypothetical protein